MLSVAKSALLRFFTTPEACTLRSLCREFKGAVSEHPWDDAETVILGSIPAWHSCFPHARVANVREKQPAEEASLGPPQGRLRTRAVEDADFACFSQLRELWLTGCKGITDAAFAHLTGNLRVLDMSSCTNPALTDAAFAHLPHLAALDMSGCKQAAITGAALAGLRGIKRLDMRGCTQGTFRDEAFESLRGIQQLDLRWCQLEALTDAAFVHLRGIKVLKMRLPQLTDAAFANLRGVRELEMMGCTGVTDKAFAYLEGIERLEMTSCNQPSITDAAFAHLKGVKVLGMGFCDQRTITSTAFTNLEGIEELAVSEGKQAPPFALLPCFLSLSLTHPLCTLFTAPLSALLRSGHHHGRGAAAPGGH